MLDFEQRFTQLTPTIFDTFKFMKFFNDVIYTQVHRPFAASMELILALVSPGEMELQEILNLFKFGHKKESIKSRGYDEL
jgi:hypothetical protein